MTLADIQVCIACGHHVVLVIFRGNRDAGLHVAYGFAGDALVADYWVHFRCIGDGPGDTVELWPRG